LFHERDRQIAIRRGAGSRATRRLPGRQGIAIWRSLLQQRQVATRSASAGGFTLVEVMVALVVFSVLGLAVSARVGDVVNQTFSLERRTVAHWIAQDQLTRLRIASEREAEAVATGRSRERVMLSAREWVVEVEVSDTAHPWLRRVELSVSLVEDGDEIGPIDHLTGFIGLH
jgi:general secretion pathway protein I